MKKIFTNLAVCGLAMLGLTANAQDKTYVVYPATDAENEVLITTEYLFTLMKTWKMQPFRVVNT